MKIDTERERGRERERVSERERGREGEREREMKRVRHRGCETGMVYKIISERDMNGKR